jgi:hypothetical protein
MKAYSIRSGDLFAYLEVFETSEGCALMLDTKGDMRVTLRLTVEQVVKLRELLENALEKESSHV